MSLEGWWLIAYTLSAPLIGFSLGFFWSWTMRKSLRSQLSQTRAAHLRLRAETFDRARALAEQQIASWTPEPSDIDEAFRQAERMANMRAMRDAGRVHLPREDGAEHGRVHTGKIRTKK